MKKLTSNNNVHLLHDRFKKIVDLFIKLEQKPRRYGTVELLTQTQIHLIELIGDSNESLSVTDLSLRQGVTKGAVSQNIKRLEQKGLAYKEEDPKNISRIFIRLTNKGKTAHYAHKLWHEKADGGFKKYFSEMKKDKIDFLLQAFDKVEDFFNCLLNGKN